MDILIYQRSRSYLLSYSIIKQRAFYEQWWFYLLISLALLSVIALSVRIYLLRKTAAFRRKEEQQQKLKLLFNQTATALVSAIDAKDKYTHGHSSRVADYSRKIAQLYGKSEEECDEIYYAALLHDVGKIGIPGSIIMSAMTERATPRVSKATISRSLQG